MQHGVLLAVCLLVVCSGSPVHAGRALLQDALSNSNGCLSTIPQCEPGACATRNVMGVARWVCLRCLANYIPVVDSSGQDNIVQCVCPKGFFEAAANATSCTRCPLNAYCPGGEKVENPTSRGNPITCGANLVTRNTGARSQVDCVAPRGYAMTSPTSATPCGASEYAPHLNRLGKCLRCQSGLQEPPNSNFTASQRDSKRAVCKVPPGKYISQGLVRMCPQGFYRENYLSYDAPLAQICVACNPGITTNGPAAGLASLCNVVLPGYGISPVYNVTGPQSIPALPLNSTNGLPNATLCGLGFYSSGGYCAQCPSGTATTRLGAQAIEECMVPPGYLLSAGSMATCSSGTYREDWLMFSDPRAATCTSCGSGIGSEARELDVNPLAANSSLVRATSASCYIDAGQGMIADGKNTFTARDCPANTYGAAGKVYGLLAAPCKPCPRNMITDGLVRVNNSDTCINPDGFGYATEGASRCAPGFYSAKGSRKPCQRCPPGRTTLDSPSAQRLITDCFVKPGYGVANSTLNSTDAYDINTIGWSADQLVNLPVVECPVGHYGVGNSTGARCQPCPFGSSTGATGSTSVNDCNVCIAGFGMASANATTCTICPQGTFQPGGMQFCQACPNSTFYAPVDGKGDIWTSTGLTTFSGAASVDSCVPKETQLAPEAGQAYFGSSAAVQSLLTNSNASNLAACLTSCSSSKCCMAQYDANSHICKSVTLDPVSVDAPGYKLLYKLPPATLGSAASVKASKDQKNKSRVRAKMMSSGIYARAALPDSTRSSWLLVGTNLDAEARTFTTAAQSTLWLTGSESDCKAKCDASIVCWGFIHTGSACLFRGGEDALQTRSFFILPAGIDLGQYNWQGATPLDTAIGTALSLAAAQGLAVTRAQVVDALNAVFAQTGAYDASAAVQRITQQQQQQQQSALSVAVGQLLELAAKQGVSVIEQEAQVVLQAQGTSFDPAAALQSILQARQGGLATAVAKVQEASAGRGFPVPTWSQAVAALVAMRPAPDQFDVDSTVELLFKASTQATDVLTLADQEGFPGFTSQQAASALLSVFVSMRDLVVDAAFKWLANQRKYSQPLLVTALNKQLLVTQQQALDALNNTYNADKGWSSDASLEWLAQLYKVALDVQAQVKEKVAGLSRVQIMSVITSLATDTGALGDDPTVEKVLQLASAADDLLTKAKEQGVSLTSQQAADLYLSGYTFTRTFDLDTTLKQLPALAEAAAKLSEMTTAQDMGIKLSAEQVISALLAVRTRVGGFDVDVAFKQLQALAAVARDVQVQADKQGLKSSVDDVAAGVVALYSNIGYEAVDAEACLAYLRLVGTQR